MSDGSCEMSHEATGMEPDGEQVCLSLGKFGVGQAPWAVTGCGASVFVFLRRMLPCHACFSGHVMRNAMLFMRGMHACIRKCLLCEGHLSGSVQKNRWR